MIAIGFDHTSGSIVISGNGVYGARTLSAALTANGGIRITSLAGRSELYVDWDEVADLTGAGFQDGPTAVAYLQGEFGKGAASTVITPYPISGAASFTASHGLDYVPRATVLDTAGNEVTTDVAHVPGQTTLIFATPFTGTLYLG